jgi:hypothetical protein
MLEITSLSPILKFFIVDGEKFVILLVLGVAALTYKL